MKWLGYVRNELKFTVPEWSQLSAKDKEDLQKYARDECAALGIKLDD